MVTSEMDGVATVEVFTRHGGHRNDFRLQCVQRSVQSRPVVAVDRDCKIGVAAKLGCAVKYACLTAHQQGAYPVALESRKDFVNLVPDQGCLPALCIGSIGSYSAAIVRLA